MAIDIKKFIGRFIEEARDHVTQLQDGLAALEAGQADKEAINTIFRSAHTIKGSSRMLKLVTITETAHKLEDVMGGLRDGSVPFSAPLGQLLYRTVDAIASLLDKLAESLDPASLPATDAALCAALTQAATGSVIEHGNAMPAAQAAPAVVQAPPAATAPEMQAQAVERPLAASPVEPRLKAAETVRVRLDKLDELIKLMGEVVSSHARMHQRQMEIRAIQAALGSAGGESSTSALHDFTQKLTDDVQFQEVLMKELHDKTLQMRMLPLSIVFEPASRLVRELGRSIGKQVECIVHGSEIELDRQLIDSLADPIIHLIRNGIDHGLETPDKRLAAGKPAQGRLTLSARQDGGWVVIDITDDGGGIALAAVREKAIKKGLISQERAQALSDQETIDLIFLPGFSTHALITELSGRGVGLDVVKQSIVDKLQGSVGVATHLGVGTSFSLRLPLSLAMMRVLLVSVRGLSFGFTAQYVSEVLRLAEEGLLTVADRQVLILRNEFVPVVALSDLLHIPQPPDSRRPGTPTKALGKLMVVVRVGHEKMALEIDELIDERDMVIKPLPEHMRRLPMVSGMVMTGRNELVSVLHAPELLDLARRLRGSSVPTQSTAAGPGERAALKILVVDDSLNTREIEKDVLEAHGYHVTLAEDGQDGFRKAMQDEFDAVLTDVEMPNMDGFTLTAKLREQEKYRAKPIVIITSREKEDDKRRGIQVGADAYIVKGDFDQSSLIDTLRTLLG